VKLTRTASFAVALVLAVLLVAVWLALLIVPYLLD
jgi:tetrahydromethanopterin S-methyltransferase subunit F